MHAAKFDQAVAVDFVIEIPIYFPLPWITFVGVFDLRYPTIGTRAA